MNDDKPKGSRLWHHMAETHNLHLLVSEEADIRYAANADAEAEIDWLRDRYKNLLGQVVQARDGFGIYRNSPTMAWAIKEGESYFFGNKNQPT